MLSSQLGLTVESVDRGGVRVGSLLRQQTMLPTVGTSGLSATSLTQDSPSKEKNLISKRIKGLFLAEFDNTTGPRITFEANDGCSVPDVFDAASDYIITGKALSGHIITVVASELKYKVMGYPMCIAHHKYDRNLLMFNVGFILDTSAKLAPYMSALQKIARTFYSMEMEDEFLSNPVKKERLKEVLPQVLKELNER